jgi:hypothetical protein
MNKLNAVVVAIALLAASVTSADIEMKPRPADEKEIRGLLGENLIRVYAANWE